MFLAKVKLAKSSNVKVSCLDFLESPGHERANGSSKTEGAG